MTWFARAKLLKFDPSEPRDKDGKWTSGGASGGKANDPATGNSLIAKLHADGGFTYHALTGDAPSPGDKAFAVAYSKTTEKVFDLNSITFENVRDYVKAHWADLKQPDHYFGGWVDSGKAYLDCSIIKHSEDEAIKVARDNDQLAYFSFEKMETVNTPAKEGKDVKKDDKKDTKPKGDVHLAGTTPEGIAKMYEALTGKAATAEQLAELTEGMKTWG